MSASVCPIATVHAPAEQVWRLLAEPANYAFWWDVQTQAIDPPGPAQPGQVIYAQTKALGKILKAAITVNEVEAQNHRIHMTTRLPFGITVYNHITCTPIDQNTSSLSFG